MSYLPIARKYRPKNFSQVVGQPHVTQTLSNAITSDRVHHAYLFCGLRGVGKTSLARIFAKCLNCESAPTITPCEQCSSCTEISRGNNLNVIEIDGASNTSVDNVRELREQVKYLPAGARYKIYIIDEVHMLSTSAFNALLKTLEEPPKHVVFMFATTEVHKIPITILSRCQRFDLRRIAPASLEAQLSYVAGLENITVDVAALRMIARAADGSMRDAQSLLDMAINMAGGNITAENILSMLGWADEALSLELCTAIATANLQEALALLQKIYEQGLDLKLFAQHFLGYLHDLVLLASLGEGYQNDERSPTQMQELQVLAKTKDLKHWQIYFQIASKSIDGLLANSMPKILFDILLVKLIHGVPFTGIDQLLTGSQKPISEKSSSMPVQLKPMIADTVGDTAPWRTWLKSKPGILAMLDDAKSVAIQNQSLQVIFPTGSMWMESFKERESEVKSLIEKQTGKIFTIEVHAGGASQADQSKVAEQQAKESMKEDPIIKDAMGILNAKIERIKAL